MSEHKLDSEETRMYNMSRERQREQEGSGMKRLHANLASE